MTTNPQTDRRERYAETLARADGWEWAAANFSSLSTPTADRYRRVAEAVMAIADAEQAELRRMADEEQPEKPDRCPHGCDTSTCPCLACEADEEQQPETQAAADLPARLEAVLTERFTELGNPFSEMRRHEQGPDGWPASHSVGPHQVAEVPRELLATDAPAAVAQPGKEG